MHLWRYSPGSNLLSATKNHLWSPFINAHKLYSKEQQAAARTGGEIPDNGQQPIFCHKYGKYF